MPENRDFQQPSAQSHGEAKASGGTYQAGLTDTAQMMAAQPAHILVADDEKGIRDILKMALTRQGFVVHIAANGREALQALDQHKVDVVISDIRMPELDGIQLLQLVRQKYDADVIIMTGFVTDYSYEQLITCGAADFVQKPASPNEMLVRLKRILRERQLIRERNRQHEKLQAAHRELRNSYLDTINRLIIAAEYKDENTGRHVMRIGRYCALIAEKIGLQQQVINNIRFSASMHDIGKIGIPDHILLKPGRLTDEEWETMKKHSEIGAAILSEPKSEILRYAYHIALTHHEWWNGEGYPNGIQGDNIPLVGRIVKVVDTFDALTSARPYKQPYPVNVALKIISRERGRQFDPRLVDIFMNNIKGILAIKQQIDQGALPDTTHFIWSERDSDYLPDILKD
ncbi:MAG: response regulator [Chitinivibrionales bacterium]|nr:response regulator [Chitinivibrionales bacterium]